MKKILHMVCVVVGLVTAMAFQSRAGWPTDEAKKAQLLGSPTSLTVMPATIELKGTRGFRQLVVNANYADKINPLRDVTGLATFECQPPQLVSIEEGGLLTPKTMGKGKLIVKAGGKTTEVPLEVTGLDKPNPVSFRHEVIAALNVGGCNMGACHGTPSGKNGFKLSLRGFDPVLDHQQLTHDVLGRRSVSHDPNMSLVLLKGLARVPHEGGQRFPSNGVTTRAVEQWLAEGMADDLANLPAVKKIEVLPGSRTMRSPAKWQQLSVQAEFTDGSKRDVTRLSVFSSSDAGIAEVNPQGVVEFRQAGEVAILVRYLEEMISVRLTYLEPKPQFVFPSFPENNYIDTHVSSKLRLMDIPPSSLCSDTDFARRVYLDLCGVLPTPEEVKAFQAEQALDKRTKLVDALLERPEYADFWTLKFSDVLRSSRKTLQTKGVHSFQQWLRERISANVGIDQIVRDILTASGPAANNPAASYYRIARDPQSLAETTAQLFFGVRMQCAKCHNHPFERWTQDDYYGFAAFFARVKTKADPNQPAVGANAPAGEIVFADRGGEVTQPRTGKVMIPRYMGAGDAKVEPGQDRREVLATWMTSPDNLFFARSMVNRIWFHVMGRGVVEPVDDFRESNPSANDPLLDALAQDFVKSGFSLKHLVRTICLSRTYQLSANPVDGNKDDTRYFSHAVSKLLTAEQMLDAICQSTEVAEKYPGLPMGTRAAQLPDGEVNNQFLKTFGQPARELACECERESDSNLAQALQLINGPTINDKLKSPANRLGRLVTAKKSDKEILADLYLSTLSRQPTPEDEKIALAHLAKAKDPRKAWEDIHWALMNTKEFLFRH